MLADKNAIYDIFRCPKSGGRLRKVGDQLISEGADGGQYKIVEGYPVLIDFENSIFRSESTERLELTVERHKYKGLSGTLKRLILPPKRVTTENVNAIKVLLNPVKSHGRVLVVGGGTVGQGMDYFYYDPDIFLVAFDVYASPVVQFLADAHRIPLADDSFDAVIVQAVLEHVLEPSVVVSEIHRVLKERGIVYAETPFLQHVHEGPYDFTRYTESGHRYLFKEFELINSGASAGTGTQLLWSLDNFFRGLFRSRKIGKMIKVLFFWLQYFDRLVPEPYNIDAASGVFFLGRKRVAGQVQFDIISHYKGAQ